MKRILMVLGLLVLMVMPAFATESAPPPAPVPGLELPGSSATCAPVANSTPAVALNELPSWLTGGPVLWSEELENAIPLGTGCAQYCMECGGCCAILGQGMCACC